MKWDEVQNFTIATLAQEISTRKISPLEVTQACLARIDRFERHLNAFITLLPDEAVAEARLAEKEIANGGWRGPLHGVPLAIKDIFCTKGVRTTCGSRVLANWTPARDATVVTRLRAAGAILLGKLNMTQFAYASIHPDFGAPRNPWNTERFTGGSSSGSAAAVAASLCFGSLGTDTGGSIRGPAAFCGLVGLKPTYGLVSRSGVVPLSWSLDHVGPIARTVEDATILLSAVAGFDPGDPASARVAFLPPSRESRWGLDLDRRPLRIGFMGDFLIDNTLSSDVADRVRDALRVVGSFVESIQEISLPLAQETVDAWSTICMAESSAYHQRYLASRTNEYSGLARSLLLAGLTIPAAQYIQAQRTRRVISQQHNTLFESFDLLVLPTKLTEAPTIAASSPSDWNAILNQARTTLAFNVSGLPAISVPCGFSKTGLPIGLQIVGPRFAEQKVVSLAHKYEQATRYWERRPSLVTDLVT